ncbi:hypothetical protein CEXT_655051 [Caerostris extrusa]|uniref:Uncharacterized protein n=1 Tax=Caerostris extrusa TaxID=172846 RepID=A0AAV4VQX6_CAEEX|nr:hypothetical protein CEXT_655051 [Caerostris extrusa]
MSATILSNDLCDHWLQIAVRFITVLYVIYCVELVRVQSCLFIFSMRPVGPILTKNGDDEFMWELGKTSTVFWQGFRCDLYDVKWSAAFRF